MLSCPCILKVTHQCCCGLCLSLQVSNIIVAKNESRTNAHAYMYWPKIVIYYFHSSVTSLKVELKGLKLSSEQPWNHSHAGLEILRLMLEGV